MQLVFVCSGNTCRSPLALAAWQMIARASAGKCGDSGVNLQRIQATSAGLCASPGAHAARHSQTVAQEWGVDLSQHRAQLFMPQHAKCDLIIVMTADQAAVVRAHFNVGDEQLRLLGSYAPRRERVAEAAKFAPLWGDADADSLSPAEFETNILDPYGASLEAYQACAAHIRRCTFELARVLMGAQGSIES